MTSRLTTKAQTTIRQPVRSALNLKPGDELCYEIQGKRVIPAKGTPKAQRRRSVQDLLRMGLRSRWPHLWRRLNTEGSFVCRFLTLIVKLASIDRRSSSLRAGLASTGSFFGW